MIPERKMKQAKRIKDGELLQGFIVELVDGECYIATSEGLDKDDFYAISPKIGETWQEVDAETIEDIAVKPIINGKTVTCPNCLQIFGYNSAYKIANYCFYCGLKFDWSKKNE